MADLSMIVGLVLFAAFTFLVFPLAVYAVVARLTVKGQGDQTALFLLTVAVSPLVLSLLLLVPYQAGIGSYPRLLVGLVVATTLSVIFVFRDQLPPALSAFRYYVRDRRRELNMIDAVALALFVVILLQIATLPMMENDALEYMAVSRHIFEAGTLSVYPVTTAAPSGLFAPPTHPPAYHLYVIWGYSWFGTETFAPARLLSVFAILAMACLFALANPAGKTSQGSISIILLLCVPLYVTTLVGYHIDPMRLVSFAAAAVGVARLLDHPNNRSALAAGILLGIAAFSHSIGILAVVFGGLTWLAIGPADRFRSLRIPLLVGIAAILVGGTHYIKNMVLYGVPLHDSLPVWEMPELHFGDDLKFRRDLVTPLDRALFGVLRGFFELPIFGVVFWATVPGVVSTIRRWKTSSSIARVSVLWMGSFFTISCATALAGTDLVIKNPRYLMTMVPLAIFVAAPFWADFFARARWPRTAVVGFACLCSSWMMLQSAWRLSNFGLRPDIAAVGERAPISRPDDRFPGAPLYRHIRDNRIGDERTLVFRQADFTLYGSGPWLDNFDDVLIPFYRLTDPVEAFNWLRRHSVRYVLLPGYYFPTASRTVIADLVGSGRFTQTIGSHRGYILYRLNDVPGEEKACEHGTGELTLSLWQNNMSLGRLWRTTAGLPVPITLDSVELVGAVNSGPLGTSAPRVEVSARSAYAQQQLVVTGDGPIDLPPVESWSMLPNSSETVELSVEIGGEGLVALDVIEYVVRATRTDVQVTRLWEGVVGEEMRRVQAQFKPDPLSKAYRVAAQKLGRAPGEIRIRNLEVCPSGSAPPASESARSLRVLAEWKGSELSVGCELSQDGQCVQRENRSSFVVKEDGSIRVFGEIGTISTMNFSHAGVNHSKRVEDWRYFFAKYPDSRVLQSIAPVFRLFAPETDEASSVRHRLNATMAGRGRFDVYVQFGLDGASSLRYAGSFFLQDVMREISLDFSLPLGAERIEMIMYGNSTSAEIASVRIEKLQ